MAEKSENREPADAVGAQPAGIDVPPEVAVHDRIMDAYYGKMGDDFMRKTQERVHWVCAQVQGGRILDVGCSQGIVPILLGREGKKVLGVDSDRDAIAVAKAHMDAGPAHVAANVDFVVADFMAHEFDEQRFDSVIMSEVLEHLVDPTAFVERAAKLLNADGRLIVTVPFGINDFVDHKRTYYLIEPYRLVSQWFEIDKIQLFSRWIGFSGKRRPEAIALDAVPTVSVEQFLAAEKTFYALERTLTENLRTTKGQLSSANQKYREVTQNQTELRKQVADKTSELEKVSSSLETTRAQSLKVEPELERATAALQEKLVSIARLEEQVAHLKGVVDIYRASEVALKADIKDLQSQSRLAAERTAELAAASSEAKRAREAFERAQHELVQSRGEIATLRSGLASLQKQRDNLDSELKACQASECSLQATETSLRSEIDSLRERYDQLSNDLVACQASEASLQATEALLRSEIASLQERYDELSSELRSCHASESSLQATEASLRAVLALLQEQRDRLRGELKACQSSESSLQAAEASLRSKLAHYHEQYKKLDDELEASRAAEATLKEELAGITSKQSVLTQQLVDTQKHHGLEQAKNAELSIQLGAAIAKATREEQAHRKVASAVRQYSQWMSDERARVSFIQHTLAFQLGSILTFALRSPSDFVKTPLRLARLIGAAFRRGPEGRPRRVFIPDLPPITADMPASSSDSAAKGIDTSAQAKGPVDASLTKSVITKAGDVVIASAAVRYPDGALTRGKHAVALIRLFDDAGGRLELPVPGFGHSPRLKGHYRYLACSAGVAREIVRFKIPSGVGRVELEIRPFNLPRGLALDVAGFEVKAEASRKGPASPAIEDDLGILGWPEYRINSKPVVLAVMDEFTTGCFENDVALILPRPDNWRALAEKYKPEVFFIESAWKGNGGSWQYRVAEYANRPGEEVADMALYASENDIPMVFWNKEDPVHHQKFMVTAKMVDHVFTTDANMLDSYREKTGNQSVHSLPFAAQPALHFPAVLEGRHNQSCFAGSWYGDRHEARGESMRWLLRAANRHGLVIFDRNHGSGNFTFPDEYHSSIQGGLPYKELCAEYRRYRVFLNVNSVTESPTMFSRRVFELMACGTPVVSTFARGIEELFESKAVWLVDSEEQADEAIRTLLSDDAEWRRRSLAGIRDVFANHTYAHRLNQLFGQIGLATRLPVDPEVLLFGLAENEGEVERLTDIARTQRYPALRLRIGARVDRSRRVQLGSTVVEVVPASQLTNGECVAGAKAMGWISAAASYGPGYVRDLANAMTYRPDAHGWGKSMGSDAFACAHPGQLQGSVWRPEYFVAGPKPGQLAQPLSGEHFFIADGAEFAANGGRAEVLEK